MNFSNQKGVRAAFAPGIAFSLRASIFINAFFSASDTTLSWCFAVLSSFVSCFFFTSKRALQFANADKPKSSGMSIGLCFFTTTSSPLVSSISTSSLGVNLIVTWLFFKSKLDMNFATGLPLLFSSLIIDSKSSHAMPLANASLTAFKTFSTSSIFLDINSALCASFSASRSSTFNLFSWSFFNLSNFFNACASARFLCKIPCCISSLA